MAVSDARFFDDIGCLRSYLAGGAEIPPGAVAFVADHRTRTWVRAASAVYTEVTGLSTPMASGLVAHADAASRDLDPDAAGGRLRDVHDVFGAMAPPGGRP
jgi:copper chaperone NosL